MIGDDNDKLDTLDLRRLRLILFYLLSNGMGIEGVRMDSLSSNHRGNDEYLLFIHPSIYDENAIRERIRQRLNYNLIMGDVLEPVVQVTDRLAEKYLIDKNKLAWIQDENTACWLWCYIKNRSRYGYSGPLPPPETTGSVDPYTGKINSKSFSISIPGFYDSTGIPDPVMNKKPLMDAIISFFDHWFTERHIKHAEIESLKSYWAEVSNQKELNRPFEFINSRDERGVEWCWEYFKRKVTILNWDVFRPASLTDKYMTLCGLFMVWRASPEAKKLILNNMKRAYSQHKFRINEKERQLFQSYIKPRHKKMLKSLAKENNSKINETIEMIIEDAYLSIKGKNKK